MKYVFLLLGLLGVGSLIGATWTVDSNMARPADFRTLQAANDSEEVVSGDILYVMPSTTGYGNLSLTKGLVIIGPGYLLNANTQLNFNVAAASARMGTLTITAGAAGNLITGMEMGSVSFSQSGGLFANNVTLKRNYIQGFISTSTGAHCGDVRILQNHITSYLSFGSTVNSGLLVRGNYFGSYVFLNNPDDSGIFAHNVVDTVSGVTSFAGSMLVENNLFRQSASLSGSAVARNNWSSSTVADNFTWDANAEPPMVFADQFVGGNPVDARWQLKADAVVRETGFGGVDPGMFAGPDPYVLSGLPSVPMVIGVQAPSSASAASGLPITVEVQVNP